MKILNFGSVNIDFVYEVPHFVGPGETMCALSRQRFPGGKGANQSVAQARAGATVYHAGKIGPDGLFIKEILMAEGVDCVSLLESGEDTTGHALIQVCGNSGENSILLFPGANFKNTRQEMIHAVNRMEPGDILLMQNEINDPEFLLQLAAEKKLKIFWNPAPMNDRVENCPLELVDCLIVNEVEAAQLAHTAFCPDDPESLKRIADCLRQKVCHAEIVITLGAAGSVYWPADRLQKPCFVPACPGPVVDTTAAGDTYLGYLIAEIAAGKDFTEAMHTASKAAALAVGHAGAIPSIPCRTALQ